MFKLIKKFVSFLEKKFGNTPTEQLPKTVVDEEVLPHSVLMKQFAKSYVQEYMDEGHLKSNAVALAAADLGVSKQMIYKYIKQ